MGYVSFDCYQSEVLFKIIENRNESSSIIVTTNLPLLDWTKLFENESLASAFLVARLTVRSYVLDMNGESYRLDHSKINS